MKGINVYILNVYILNTNNPREFWSELNNLGPCKKTCIPMELYDDTCNGIVLSNHRPVLNRWACDYKELYKGYDTNEFDADFL